MTDVRPPDETQGSKATKVDLFKEQLQSQRERRSHNIRRMWLWNFTVHFSYRLKRLIDIVASSLALLLLTPFILLIALAIKATSDGPVFFVQTRVGKYGRHFRFYKFRSMYVGAERQKHLLMSQNESADGVIFKMKNDPRVTPVGRFLRKYSIDELPQLFNVLTGDMSLVGPRPPLPEEVAHYTISDRKRLDVKPGLTCFWQIEGRSAIPFKQQVALDEEYIRSWSLKQDLLILLKTIPAILSGKGAY